MLLAVKLTSEMGGPSVEVMTRPRRNVRTG